jgi:hypothetical protein
MKMVEALFIGPVNGSSRNKENKRLRALHTLQSDLLKMRFCLGSFVIVNLCEENLVRTAFKYSDNSKYLMLRK